jgi:hypothetical protein
MAEGDAIVELADDGVPESVIDVMIAGRFPSASPSRSRARPL